MKVVVIGGGAAGMFSAINAANNNKVILLEKTKSLGNKIKITGKGRCNLTFDGDSENFKSNILKNYKFMYSSFTNFTNKDLVTYFNSLGVETKVERGGRIFPISDDANTIIEALKKDLKKNNVDIKYNAKVEGFEIKDNKLVSVILSTKEKIPCDKCIIATGGKSYPLTGSTGDGYILAKSIGHKIVDIKAGLVPLKSDDNICKELQGLSLKNISFKLEYKDGKKIYEDFGELLFAHFGITGPVVLSASSKLNREKDIEKKLKEKEIYAIIDLKPALEKEVLDKRICRDFEKYSNKEFKNSLDDLLPQKIIKEIIRLSGIEGSKKVNEITKKERQSLVNVLKNIKINICDFMPLDMAVITCGGVDVSDINPKTMESKLVKGIYFAGEILDIDAYTGGYNLQIAFSTAYQAGKNI